MNTLERIGATIARRFIDDGGLAIWIAFILAAAGFVASTPWCDDRCVGGGLVVAVIAALLASVRRASRQTATVSCETGAGSRETVLARRGLLMDARQHDGPTNRRT